MVKKLVVWALPVAFTNYNVDKTIYFVQVALTNRNYFVLVIVA